jgi:hypothetical protein
MKKYAVLLILLLTYNLVIGQSKFTISGYVKDSASNETLINANISVLNDSKTIATNSYGFFSITLTRGKHTFLITYAGYNPIERTFDLQKNEEVVFLLNTKRAATDAVIVTARKKDANVKNTQMGKFEISSERVKTLPSLLGEADILKTIQLLPGIRNAGEGNAGFYVRGGGPDQNLIVLDDAVVYNSGHLFGFFSVFNADAIKNTTVIKGGMPAQYGGRLSSVLDISMKDGNNKKYEIDGGIGTIASRLTIQGPIKKEKASFMVSARRTYIDALVKPFIKETSNAFGSGYYFYDLNAKANYRFSAKDKVYLSGYFGKDVFDFASKRSGFKANIPWGNSTATVRWNHVFNNKLFANSTLVYNDYKFAFNSTIESFKIGLNSGIRDYTAKVDFDYYPFTNHKIKFGAAYTNHKFTPSIFSAQQDTTVFSPNNASIKYANEKGIYIQDDIAITDNLAVNVGMRYSSFTQVGPHIVYQNDAAGNRIDSTKYNRGKKIITYDGWEPRATMRYNLNESSSIKMSYSKNYQYIHLVSNSGNTLPTDIWVPSTYKVKPQESNLFALGYFKNLKNNVYETSVELYYKKMNNQIEYREGYTQTVDDIEKDFVFGKGWSYGSEFFINKVQGKLTGWIGYTLSYTWRQFNQLNGGNKFPSKFDRRHDLSVVTTYELNKKWKLSGVFVYGTGNATTIPTSFYFIGTNLVQESSSLNGYRLKPYHRLDFSATYTPKPKKGRKLKSTWNFGVYNAYSRLNPFFIYFDQTGSVAQGDLKVQAKQVSLFPIIPSVTWNFKL